MAEYIEREAMVKRFTDMIAWCENELPPELSDFRRGCIAALKDELNYVQKSIPTADVVERKRGEWFTVYDAETDVPVGCVCSKCRKFNRARKNLCPNCGADMRGESDG